MDHDLWLLILSSPNQRGIIALIYCVVMDFSQRGNFLLEVFQDWVYQYFMEAHNNVFYFVFTIPHQKFSASWQI